MHFDARTSRVCFYHLRRLRAARSRLGQDIAARLVGLSAFVLSRVDYCNAILAGLPASTLAPLQKVINVAARLVLNLKPHDHITAALRALHWLPNAYKTENRLQALPAGSSCPHWSRTCLPLRTSSSCCQHTNTFITVFS